MTWPQTLAFTAAVWAVVGAVPLVCRRAGGWLVVRRAVRITRQAARAHELQTERSQP